MSKSVQRFPGLPGPKSTKPKKQPPKLNYPTSENFPHPLDAAIKVDQIPKHKAVGGIEEAGVIDMNTPSRSRIFRET